MLLPWWFLVVLGVLLGASLGWCLRALPEVQRYHRTRARDYVALLGFELVAFGGVVLFAMTGQFGPAVVSFLILGICGAGIGRILEHTDKYRDRALQREHR